MTISIAPKLFVFFFRQFFYSSDAARFSGRGRACNDQTSTVNQQTHEKGTSKSFEHKKVYIKPVIAAGNAAMSRHMVFLRSRGLDQPADGRTIIRAPSCPPRASNTMASGVESMPLDAVDDNDGCMHVGALLPADPHAYLDAIEISLSDNLVDVDVSSDDSKDGVTHSPTGS
jgi:hypothetical protein